MKNLFLGSIGAVIFMVLSSCAGKSEFRQKQVTVLDVNGQPILGVSTYPQPFVSGSKASGADGKLNVYGLVDESVFRLNAVGYKSKDFSFGRSSSVCVLEKSPSR